MIVGYAALRPGLSGADITAAHSALISAGVQRLFIDIDQTDGERGQLAAAIDAVGAGDMMVCASLETLTRSPRDLIDIVARLEARGASLRVLQIAGGLPLDTATVEGRAMLGALAIISALAPAAAADARKAQSVEAGHSAPFSSPPASTIRPRGRPATAGIQSGEVARLHAEGLRAVDIASRLGIGRASVYRILSQGGGVPVDLPRDATIGRAASLARRLHQSHDAE